MAFSSMPLQDMQSKEIKGLIDITQSETQIIWKPCDTVNDLLSVLLMLVLQKLYSKNFAQKSLLIINTKFNRLQLSFQ